MSQYQVDQVLCKRELPILLKLLGLFFHNVYILNKPRNDYLKAKSARNDFFDLFKIRRSINYDGDDLVGLFVVPGSSRVVEEGFESDEGSSFRSNIVDL